MWARFRIFCLPKKFRNDRKGKSFWGNPKNLSRMRGSFKSSILKVQSPNKVQSSRFNSPLTEGCLAEGEAGCCPFSFWGAKRRRIPRECEDSLRNISNKLRDPSLRSGWQRGAFLNFGDWNLFELWELKFALSSDRAPRRMTGVNFKSKSPFWVPILLLNY